jgi:uncharacterized membrane protein HdeD (DUF308 family)
MSASVPYSPGTYPAEPGPPSGATAAPAVSTPEPAERSAWWLAIAASILGVVLGVMIIVWPTATLKVVAALFGLWLLIHGLVRLVQAVTGPGRSGGERAVLGIIGVFFVVAGVVALRNLLLSLALIVTLIGLTWLIGGLVELISAIGGGRGTDRMWHVGLGLLSIVAGVVVLVWPHLTLVALVYITGIWTIVMSLAQLVMLFWARRTLTAPVEV